MWGAVRVVVVCVVAVVLALGAGSSAARSTVATVGVYPSGTTFAASGAAPGRAATSVSLAMAIGGVDDSTILVSGAQNVAIASPTIASPLQLKLFFAHYVSVNGTPVPDALLPWDGSQRATEKANQPLWLQVTVPAGTTAGTYSGSVVVVTDGSRRTVPLSVTVSPVTLPATNQVSGSLLTAFNFSPQSYGAKDNSYPPQLGYPDGFPDTTIFAALSAKDVSNRYFFVDEPVSALWGQPGANRSSRVEEYYQRCQSGTLPALSFVDPSFGNESGGTSGDQHPHGDIRTGDAYMSDVVHAFMESPQWKRGALFIVYDEWGGFFDHVAAPRVPDVRSSRDIDKDYGLMGFRIPAVAISPWVRRRHVAHSVYGFESILKLIEYRLGLKPLTVRDRYARNIGRGFDFESKPRLEVPDLPRPEHVVSQACPNEAALAHVAAANRPKQHDLMDMVTSGYLERLGFQFEYATPPSTFREPHKVSSALTL